jgi:hypothetical protein
MGSLVESWVNIIHGTIQRRNNIDFSKEEIRDFVIASDMKNFPQFLDDVESFILKVENKR